MRNGFGEGVTVMRRSFRIGSWAVSALLFLFLANLGIPNQDASQNLPESRSAEISTSDEKVAPEVAQTQRMVLDEGFMSSLPEECVEVALFQIRLGDDPRQLFAESVLSKTLYDRTLQHELEVESTGVVPALKWRFFHELFEGPSKAYHMKDAKFLFMARPDLTLLKQSWIWTSWEGGGHQTLVLRQPDGSLTLSSGPKETIIATRPDVFVQSQVPLIVRAMDFSEHLTQSFWTVLTRPFVTLLEDGRVVVTEEAGTLVRVEAQFEAKERLKVGDEETLAEHVVVRYLNDAEQSRPERLLFATSGSEHYWRQAEGTKQVVRLTTTFYGRPLTMDLLEERIIDLPVRHGDAERQDSNGCGSSYDLGKRSHS